MAGSEDRSPSPSLADLWLRGATPQKKRPAAEAESSRASSAGQLDLLFGAPERSPSGAVPPRPQQQVDSRRPAVKPATDRGEVVRAEVNNPPPPLELVAQERRVWSVGDLVNGIRLQLEREYEDVWVEGEISNCRPASSGHIYFTLKDGEAQLSVVLFRRQAMLLRFRPQDGLAVLVRGRVSVYDSRGQLQLIAETMEPRGAGALQLAFEQLKARLLAEGLFDASRKRPLPTFPHCIGVITSTGGAVLHDIIKVVRRRHACLNLLVYPAIVQGPGCAPSVAAGIEWFNAHPETVDVILIARGGGSLEDLAGFNDEALARAIAASKLPTVSAVGHETDFTIADFVADLRAPTPSAAAEMITAAQHRIEEQVQALDLRLRRATRYQLIVARQRLSDLSAGQVLQRVRDLINRRGQRLDDLHRRLEFSALRHVRRPAAQVATLTTRVERQNPAGRLATAHRRLDRAQHALLALGSSAIQTRKTGLEHATGRLAALSPLAVLSRGYALVYSADGKLLRSSGGVNPGDAIRARLGSGAIDAQVTRIEEETEEPA